MIIVSRYYYKTNSYIFCILVNCIIYLFIDIIDMKGYFMISFYIYLSILFPVIYTPFGRNTYSLICKMFIVMIITRLSRT